jgi:hypothetical protein
MAAKKDHHKPAEDPRTLGGGLKAARRERREKLSMIINSTPRHKRNDLLPTMELQTLAIADLKMPKHMVRKLDEGHIKEVAHGIQAMGFSGDQGRARRRSAECSLRKNPTARGGQEYGPLRASQARRLRRGPRPPPRTSASDRSLLPIN